MSPQLDVPKTQKNDNLGYSYGGHRKHVRAANALLCRFVYINNAFLISQYILKDVRPIAYNDRQMAELELHKVQLGLTNKQM